MSPVHVWLWFSFICIYVCGRMEKGEEVKELTGLFGYLAQIAISGFVLFLNYISCHSWTWWRVVFGMTDQCSHKQSADGVAGLCDCVAFMVALWKREHCHLVNLSPLRPWMTQHLHWSTFLICSFRGVWVLSYADSTSEPSLSDIGCMSSVLQRTGFIYFYEECNHAKCSCASERLIKQKWQMHKGHTFNVLQGSMFYPSPCQSPSSHQ